MKATCLQCGCEFHGEPNVINGRGSRKGKRFCSKRCWYDWNKGSNNHIAARSPKADIQCDHCGNRFEKIPSHVGKLNYCSQKCSRLAHRGKIKGERNVGWSGGSLASRGSAWDRIRMEVIVEQGGQCARCGMTMEEHKKKYKKSLGVHHKALYRLDPSNNRQNLEALCLPCHRRADAILYRELTAKQRREMADRLAEYQANGKDIPNYSCVYDLCPECGKKKAKKAKFCRSCRNRFKRESNPKLKCPLCGKIKKKQTKEVTPCATCYANIKLTSNPKHKCPCCGGFKKSIRAETCMACRKASVAADRTCSICGGKKVNPKANCCWSCRYPKPVDPQQQTLPFILE
jgi:hypothetical protein